MSTTTSTATRRVTGRPTTPPSNHQTLPPLPKGGFCPMRSLGLYIFAICFHYTNVLLMALAHLMNHAYWATQAPNLTKTYSVRPGLTHRIHLPPIYKSESETKYPTIFLLHGGGWVIGSPSADDEQAHLLSKAGFVVVSLEYALAPWNRFPGPLHDVAALIPVVLADTSLPIDKTRVVISGFSAGATMSLAVAQMPALRSIIKAVVAIQPVTDFSEECRGQATPTSWGTKDKLEVMQPLFNWAYVPTGQDLRAPLLSPIFAGRSEIRAPVMIVTGGADMLCDEAGLMACRLAGREGARSEVRGDWEDVGRGVRLLCVGGMPHCFTHFWVKPKGEWVEKRAKIVEGVWEEVVGWLGRTLELQEE